MLWEADAKTALNGERFYGLCEMIVLKTKLGRGQICLRDRSDLDASLILSEGKIAT